MVKEEKANENRSENIRGAYGGAVRAFRRILAVYYFNLDMRLMRSVVLPFLNRHYDSVKREHII